MSVLKVLHEYYLTLNNPSIRRFFSGRRKAEKREAKKGESESPLAPKEGLILRLTVKRDKMYASTSKNIPLKGKKLIQGSETVTDDPASPSFRVCDCRAHAVYGPLLCSIELLYVM